jgi:acetyl/propionyl-CoA carboxylase alpha subunit
LLRSARSEAQSAFGDATVILERAIADPRHIEIQVFGDAMATPSISASAIARCSGGTRN